MGRLDTPKRHGGRLPPPLALHFAIALHTRASHVIAPSPMPPHDPMTPYPPPPPNATPRPHAPGPQEERNTALHVAAARGDPAVVQALLAAGANIGARDAVRVCPFWGGRGGCNYQPQLSQTKPNWVEGLLCGCGCGGRVCVPHSTACFMRTWQPLLNPADLWHPPLPTSSISNSPHLHLPTPPPGPLPASRLAARR